MSGAFRGWEFAWEEEAISENRLRATRHWQVCSSSQTFFGLPLTKTILGVLT
jgi:hypothetical protein